MQNVRNFFKIFAIFGHKLAKFLFLYYQPYSRSVPIKIAHMLSSVRQAVHTQVFVRCRTVGSTETSACGAMSILLKLRLHLGWLTSQETRNPRWLSGKRMELCSKLIFISCFYCKISGFPAEKLILLEKTRDVVLYSKIPPNVATEPYSFRLFMWALWHAFILLRRGSGV